MTKALRSAHHQMELADPTIFKENYGAPLFNQLHHELDLAPSGAQMMAWGYQSISLKPLFKGNLVGAIWSIGRTQFTQHVSIGRKT